VSSLNFNYIRNKTNVNRFSDLFTNLLTYFLSLVYLDIFLRFSDLNHQIIDKKNENKSRYVFIFIDAVCQSNSGFSNFL